MNEEFVVYENWQENPKKAVVHVLTCGHVSKINPIQEKINDNWLKNIHEPNGRWFGYFNSLDKAVAFGELLPNRKLKMCGHCLKNFKDSL